MEMIINKVIKQNFFKIEFLSEKKRTPRNFDINSKKLFKDVMNDFTFLCYFDKRDPFFIQIKEKKAAVLERRTFINFGQFMYTCKSIKF